MRRAVFTLAVTGLVLMAGSVCAQTPAPKLSDAGPNDFRMLAVNSLRTALDRGLPGAEKVIGHHIVIVYGTASGNLKNTIMGGQDFEIALLTPDVNAELAKAGKIAPGEIQFATGRMGFALRGEAKVDVSGPDAIRKTLLTAKSVVFSPMSSGLPAIQKMLDALGIADAIKHNNSGSPQVPLGPGEYEIFLYPMSEIVTNKEWKNLGLFPDAWQVPVLVKAVTGLHARDSAATKALMDYLTGPAMTAILAEDAWGR
jgi:molybdate transport system substrate-binding protein